MIVQNVAKWIGYLLFLIVATDVYAADAPFEGEDIPLRGPVKSIVVKEYKFTSSFGVWKVNDLPERANSTSYDVSGNVVEDAYYDKTGKRLYKCVTTYNIAQKVSAKRCYDEYGRVSGETIYSYDVKNNIASINYKYDDIIVLYTYKYNSLGKQLEENRYENGFLRYKVITDYHPDGGSKKVYQQFDDQIYETATDIKVNALNQIVDKTYFKDSKETEIEVRFVYSYDKGGNNIETAQYDNLGLCVCITKKFYDEHGNCVESQSFGENGVLFRKVTIEYEYDSYGNWIRLDQTTYSEHDGNTTVTRDTLTTRDIIYYQ